MLVPSQMRLALVVCWGYLVMLAQARREILSTVIYTNHGDRTPLIRDEYHHLSSLGARQLYEAGTKIRAQYIAPPPNSSDLDSPTWRLLPDYLEGEYFNILAANEQYNAASAQAFMQALYPPLAANGTLRYIDASFVLADGNITQAPLEGIQYPTIPLSREDDIDALWVKGASDCPAYRARMDAYRDTAEYEVIRNNSQEFYDQLLTDDFVFGFAENAEISYANAWYIYDFLNYQNTHNRTFADTMPPEVLAEARVYATNWVWTMFANTSETGKVGDDPLAAMAGRTFAARVVALFANSILNRGVSNKVNLIFGDYQPMVSFAALAGLMVPQHSNFYNMPAPGASYIFELFAIVPDTDELTDYPDSTDMFVRFLYTNGTDEYDSTIEYALFGASPSRAIMPLSEFTSSMAEIMIRSTSEYCNVCQSTSLFCVAVDALTTTTPRAERHGLSPVVAGVIGALVALAFALVVLALVMLFGRVRMYRVPSKRQSNLGGFKGAEKLASDQDLTMGKSGAGATVVTTVNDDTTARGHERVGSWELRDQAMAKETQIGAHRQAGRRSSFDDDEIRVNPFSDPVKPRDSF